LILDSTPSLNPSGTARYRRQPARRPPDDRRVT